MTYGKYPSLDGVKKVLVVKLRHLGDVLLSSPVFSVLKERLPHAAIDAYVYQEARSMLEGHPAIREILCYDREIKRRGFFSKLSYELSLLRQIRREKYDLILNLTEGDRGLWASRVSRAAIRVGSTSSKVYTHRYKEAPGCRHTVERNLDALRILGLFPEPRSRALTFYIPQEAKERVDLLVGDQPFVLIHPASRWRFKCWSVANMRRVIEWLLGQGMRVVITAGGDPEEKAMVEQLSENLAVLNLAGKVSLKELGALVEKAQMTLCVDSVCLHLTSALKRPVVVLFGPTSEKKWGPWQNPDALVLAEDMPCRPCYQDGCGGSKYSDCLETLSVEKVQEALKMYAFIA